MKPTEFYYWLKGFFEIGEPTELNSKQIELIKNYLDKLVCIDDDTKLNKEDDPTEIIVEHPTTLDSYSIPSLWEYK